MTDSLLQLNAVSAGYSQGGKSARTVVTPFSASIAPGSLICLIGPNGAGKSTLLRTIAGMQKPLGGQVLLHGRDMHRMNALERAKLVSIVLTQKADVGLLTGYELVALGRHPHTGWMGQLTEHDHRAVRRSIALVGAEHLADRQFNRLSDGERQKMMIARALAQEPELLILDEPTAFLDLPRRVECMALLSDLARRTGRTILLSSHDLDLALRYASRIWLLGYGGHVREGLPEDLVLNGDFEAAFQSASVSFDMLTGAFRPSAQWIGHVVLEGDGVQHIWTKRALEREGFSVASERVSNLPVIRVEATPKRWQFIQGDASTYCNSLEELMNIVRAAQPI